MRVLLLHPDSSVFQGTWAQERWDVVVDLGFASHFAYSAWSKHFGTRVLSIYEYERDAESYRWVNQIFDYGRDKLLDDVGLDWWELLAMERYQDLQVLFLFYRLKSELGGSGIDLWATKPHRFARISEQVLGVRARYFWHEHTGRKLRRAVRSLYSARNLRPTQILEVACDKWDGCFQWRRHWTKRKRARLLDPAVLLPSAYSNVTRSALAYARQLPKRRFLLATTRRSATAQDLLENVLSVPLAAYVSAADRSREETAMLNEAWWRFVNAMKVECKEFRDAADAGLWDYFPAHLAQGIVLREAWSRLLASEPVVGVLCADDLNYHTRLPLMLSRRAGLNAIYCSHGALDGGFFFKRPIADIFLVKGEMERDYLHRAANIPGDRIVIGAPGENVGSHHDYRRGEALVFFSQPYEVAGGRADSIYTEIVPRLCAIAHETGRKVIVKLHPFESKRARTKLVNSVIGTSASSMLEIVDGATPEQVMSQVWCGVTVDSSVAVECALRNIPFFLCGWLDFTGMGYLQQFANFGVGQVLHAPEEIERIPELIAEFRMDRATTDRLWRRVDPSQLDDILFGSREVRLHSCAS